jgi:hypothetical protein
LDVTIRSHSGHEYSFEVPLLLVVVETITTETSVSGCLNAMHFDGGSWGEGDLICLYDYDEVVGDRLAVNFSVVANFDIGYDIEFRQDFSNLTFQWGLLKDQVTNTGSTWWLPVPKDHPSDSWIAFSMDVAFSSDITPREFDIHFIRTDAARPSVYLEMIDGRNNIVRETGEVDVQFIVGVDGNLPAFSGLSFRTVPLLEALRDDMESSICKWSLVVGSQEEGRHVNHTHEAGCGAEVAITEGGLRVTLPMDSLLAVGQGVTSHASLPLFMLESAKLQITFIHRSTEQVYSLDLFPKPEVIPSNPSKLNLPDTEECKGIKDEFILSLEDAVNWDILGKCLSDSTAEDGLPLVGFRFRWIEPVSSNDEEEVVHILCPIDQTPATFEEWWDIEANRCLVIGELPERNQQFLEAYFDAVGCSFRCSIEEMGTETILEFDTADGSLSMGFGYVSDPDIGAGKGAIYASSLLLILVIVKFISEKITPIFRKGKTQTKLGGDLFSEPQEVLNRVKSGGNKTPVRGRVTDLPPIPPGLPPPIPPGLPPPIPPGFEEGDIGEEDGEVHPTTGQHNHEGGE